MFFTIGEERTVLGFTPAISYYFAIATFAAIVAGIIKILVF